MPNFRSLAGPTKASASGFTLIELMITVAIVALLAAVALPSYTEYIRRGRLVDGTNSLSACRVTMEQYFQDNRTYVGGACAAPTSSDSLFAVAVDDGADATTYTVTATGSGTVDGFVYTINQRGVTATTGLPSGWGDACASAWITRKGQACPG